MATKAWTRSHWTDAELLAQSIDADVDAPEAARGKTPDRWFAELLAADNLIDAISFLAHALPRYDCAVWAARALIEARVIDPRAPATVAILRWIDEPSDTLRRAAHDAAETLRNGSPAKMLAQAIFLSGGSIAPPDFPPVQPPPQACPRMASAALLAGLYPLDNPMAALRGALALGETFAVG